MPDNVAVAQASAHLEELETKLECARRDLGAGRERLDAMRGPLKSAELRVRKCWAKRKAAIASLQISERASKASGVGKTALASLSVSRFQQTASEASEEIRQIIAASSELCTNFESAWEFYFGARNAERIALEMISEVKVVQAGPLPAVQKEPVVPRPAGPPNPSGGLDPIRLRQQRARSELRALKVVRAQEEIVRAKELALENDGHYDPNYDEHELLIRRIRPWV